MKFARIQKDPQGFPVQMQDVDLVPAEARKLAEHYFDVDMEAVSLHIHSHVTGGGWSFTVKNKRHKIIFQLKTVLL